MKNNCMICQKHLDHKTLPGGVIFENEHLFIAHFPLIETEKAYRGHLIIELKRHITQPSQMNIEEAKQLGLWMQKISQAQETTLKAEHTYVSRIGDKVNHLHFHMIPRYPNTPKEFWGVNIVNSAWRDIPRASEEDMIEITANLKKFIADHP